MHQHIKNIHPIEYEINFIFMVKVKNQQIPTGIDLYYYDDLHPAGYKQAYRRMASPAYIIDPVTGMAVVRKTSVSGRNINRKTAQGSQPQASLLGKLKFWECKQALTFCSQLFASLPHNCDDCPPDYKGPTKKSVFDEWVSSGVGNTYIDLFNQCCIPKYNKMDPPYDPEDALICYPAECNACKDLKVEDWPATISQNVTFTATITGMASCDTCSVEAWLENGLVEIHLDDCIINGTASLNDCEEEGDIHITVKNKSAICITEIITIERPIIECSGSIYYATNQMSINESQTLSVLNPTSGAAYSWSIISGEGSLSDSTGLSTIYTAPDSNYNCNKNPTIRLSCLHDTGCGTPTEIIIQEIKIAVNAVINGGYDAYSLTGVSVPPEGCYEWGNVNSTFTLFYDISYFDCAGNILHMDIHVPLAACGATTSGVHCTDIIQIWVVDHYETRSVSDNLKLAHDNCMAANGPSLPGLVDYRSGLQRAYGCCPFILF
jgi:hypothetical protein